MCRETVHIVRAVELEGITWITYNRPVHAIYNYSASGGGKRQISHVIPGAAQAS